VAKGYEVHAVSSKPSGENGTVHWHKADLLDARQCEGLVWQVQPTHLLHFAWYAVHGKYWTSVENLRWVQASLELMQAFTAVGGKRAVMAGTCAEYDWGFGHCSEKNTPLVPATLYGTCKHALQITLAAWSGQAGLSSAWGRIFSLYGPHEHPARLVASVIAALLRGEEAACSNGGLIRDYLHVADVASAFVALLDSDLEGPVNIGSGTGVALKDIVGTIGSKIAQPDLIRFSARPLPVGEPPLLVADTARLSRTGWRPSFDLDSGLNDTIAWWMTQFGRSAMGD
jgi:nucleoside-diphosphate-sugar epimerase